jgi:hypothetical protein
MFAIIIKVNSGTKGIRLVLQSTPESGFASGDRMRQQSMQ